MGSPSPGGVAQLVERVLYHSTRRAVPERSWVQSLLPTTEVEPGFSTFGGMLVPVLQLISPVCKTGTSLQRYGKWPRTEELSAALASGLIRAQPCCEWLISDYVQMHTQSQQRFSCTLCS
jgi:hypothetical protein